MRLKRLELFGFKSFADRTVLDFEHDLVGIVGPNGCGKSNVVDAVRWILGEQRARSMRGGEMTDVIFKGSVSRPALSMAEGTVVFDNGAGMLEAHGDEVSVTRRVYASGEGEYLIDGARVRLKDVREMLFGTGLGSRGYSVLEQGKIDAILSANPLERRSIFEEAAGVSRYRQRKKETESRLKRVQADLLRLEDVIGELEKRERSLKIQAGRARRFVEARDAWREDGHRLARHQLHGLAGTIAECGGVLRELETEVEAQRARRVEAESTVLARGEELSVTARRLETSAQEASDVAAEIRGLSERHGQLVARVEAWRASSEDERQRSETLRERAAERGAQKGEVQGELTRLEARLGAAQERVERLASSAQELAEECRGVARASEEKNETVLELFEALHSTRNRGQHLQQSTAPLAEREERAALRLEEARGELGAAAAREATAAEHVAAAEAAHRAAAGARADCERVGQELDARLGELDARRSELELACARLASRVESLRDWEREREGLESGARALLEAMEAGEGPALEEGLRGLFADHVRADTRVARALDAALGDRAQALVVRSRRDALGVLAWLKERRSGRVSVLVPPPLSEGREPSPGRFPEPPAELLGEAGVEGRLIDFCTPRADAQALTRALLGDVVLVSDAAAAQDLAGRYPRQRFVTADGDLVDAVGLHGGHTEVSHGPVGRRSSADELEAERGRHDQELVGVSAEIAAERERRRGAAARLSELREAVSAAGVEHARAVSNLEAERARLTELERSVGLCEHECHRLVTERAEVERELRAAAERLRELEETYAAERAELEALEERRKELEEARATRAREEGEARVEAAGVQERRDALRRRQRDLEQACTELDHELQRALRLTEEHRANAASGEAEASTLIEQRGALEAQRAALEERVEALRVEEREGRAEIDGLRRRAEELTGTLESLMERVSEVRLEKQRQELAREEIVRRSREDFGQEEAELLADFEPEPELVEGPGLDELQAHVTELKRSMEKLGPVNLEAVDELQEVAERLGFLTTQRQDLNEARRGIEGTLAQLNEESEKRFVEAFEEIGAEFKLLFRQLFGGGRAEITLLDPDDVLECGIEIIARPPGRESLPISLLSGGQRTLTALALLFAVFRRNSSPFCILDEVDAALDDANIGRFLAMVESNLEETQYIIVTHNKGTMSACQVLYGVTMAIKGVSSVVSVELGSVDEFVPEATGSAQARDASAEDEPEEEPEPDAEPEEEAAGILRPLARPAPPASAAPTVEDRPASAPDSGDDLEAEADDGTREVVLLPGAGLRAD